jgi:hypothetical protein
MRTASRQVINYIAVFIVFSDALTFRDILPFMELRSSYFLLALVLVLCIPLLKGVYFNRTFLFLFGAIIVFSLCNIYVEKDSFFLLAKQVIGIFSSSLIFYLLMKANEYDVKRLFKVYLNLAFLVGLIGLFQELSFLLGFRAGYDFSYIFTSWRLYLSQAGFLKISSILPEPASFCYVMIPAFFAALTSFSKSNFKFLNKWRALVIILSVVLSFSLVGYIGMVLSFMLLLFNYTKIRYLVVGTVLISILMFFAYVNVADLKIRIDDSINAFTGKTKLEETNLSTFTLFSNALVAWESFKDNPVFGSGLGSHSISHDRYMEKVVDVDAVMANYKYTFLNKGDTSSLFLRLVSETGLLGLFFIFCFVFRFWILKKNDKSGFLWVVSNAILAVFLIRAIRGGHYFVGGIFFFMWLYYFAGKSVIATPKNYRGVCN